MMLCRMLYVEADGNREVFDRQFGLAEEFSRIYNLPNI